MHFAAERIAVACADSRGQRIGTERLIATFTFTPTQLLQDGGTTSINWRIRVHPIQATATWFEDLNAMYGPTGLYQAGAPVVLTYDKPDIPRRLLRHR